MMNSRPMLLMSITILLECESQREVLRIMEPRSGADVKYELSDVENLSGHFEW